MCDYYLVDRNFVSEDYLCHYGVKGMKWGIRRYQNPDGSLTPEAKKRAKKEYKEDNKKLLNLEKMPLFMAMQLLRLCEEL